MEDQKRPRAWITLPRLVTVGVLLALAVAVSCFVDYRKSHCDRTAQKDARNLAAALERLFTEFSGTECPPPNLTKKHIAYMVGPYYGWHGTSRKCQVRLRVERGEALLCADRGSSPKGSDTRYLYRVALNSPASDLPPTIGGCYGDTYGGPLDPCYLSSIADSLCLRGGKAKHETVEACEAIRRKNRQREESFRSMAAKSVNAFSVELYKKLVREDSNLVVSPLGYYIPLAMVYAGARGDTFAQMTHVMRLHGAGPELHQVLGAFAKELKCSVAGTDGHFDLDSLLLVKKKLPILKEFKDLINSCYGLDLDRLEFGPNQDTGPSLGTKLPRETRSKRQQIAKGVTDSDTSLILNSTIDFNGMWTDDHNFDQSDTADAPFYLLDEREINVPLMFRQSRFRYMEDKDLQALELLYQEATLSMVVILPREKKGLPDLEKAVTSESLSQWLSKLDYWPYGVKVWLPRFEISTNLDLGEPLKAMGMSDAFCSPYKGCTVGKMANFSGITGRADPNVEQPLTDLFLTEATQTVSLEVNEKGTEVRAESILCSQVGGSNGEPSEKNQADLLQPPPPEPKIFRADHPFLFVVRHNPSGCILFVGRLTIP